MLTEAEKLKILYYKELVMDLSRDAESNRAFGEAVYDLLVADSGENPVTASINREFRIDKYIVSEIEAMAPAQDSGKREEWIEKRFSTDAPKKHLDSVWQEYILALNDPPDGWQPTPEPVAVKRSEPGSGPAQEPAPEPEPAPAVKSTEVYFTATDTVALGGVVDVPLNMDFDPDCHVIDLNLSAWNIDPERAVLVENTSSGYGIGRIISYGQDFDGNGVVDPHEYICFFLKPSDDYGNGDGHIDAAEQAALNEMNALLHQSGGAWLDMLVL